MYTYVFRDAEHGGIVKNALHNQGMILIAGNKFVTKKFFDFHKVEHV